jgi:hypothetical protein
MDKEQQDHLEEVRKLRMRRLRILEVRAARLGDNTPADVIMEMEDLRDGIAKINAELSSTEPVSVDTRIAPSEKVLQIVLNIDYAEWNSDLQAAALRAFAAVMDIPPDKVKIIDIQPGSVKVILRVPKDAADRLLDLYNSGHPIIHDLYIESVTNEDQNLAIVNAAPSEPLLRRALLEQRLKELQEQLDQQLEELQKRQEPLLKELQILWMEELLEQLDQQEQQDQQLKEQQKQQDQLVKKTD